MAIACDHCGVDFIARKGARFCSTQCRDRWHYANTRTGMCYLCGEPMRLSTSSSKEGNAHRSCRSAQPSPPCPDCGGQKDRYSIRCFRCAMVAKRFRPDDDHRSTRRARECSAPGLTVTERRKLLARWLRQGRTCTYCPNLAATIDHVVPLIRGGTNFEGNLVPACRSCNSRKRHWLVIELHAKGVRRDQDVRPMREGVRGLVEPREVLRVNMPGA